MRRLKLGVFAPNARIFKDYERDSLPMLKEVAPPDVEVSIRQCRTARDITDDLTSVIFLPTWDHALSLAQRRDIQHHHALWAARSIAADE